MNPISKLKFFLGPGMFQHTINLSILAVICWVALIQFPEWEFLGYPLWISLILVSTVVIWRAGDFFSPGAEYIQKKRKLPESVKAAVIDAIASSFPEFCVAVIAVIILGRAEVGISSIVGSALYNVLVIPVVIFPLGSFFAKQNSISQSAATVEKAVGVFIVSELSLLKSSFKMSI